MKLVNLTPHTIVIRGMDGVDVSIPSEGLARVDNDSGMVEYFEWLPCPLVGPPTFGKITGLPDPAPGVCYIASAMVAERAARQDVFSPGTGPKDMPIREPDTLPSGAFNHRKGQIIAVTRLIKWAERL